MGEMADSVLVEVLEMESLRDDYVCGHLSDSDAYELGFLDSSGMECEGMQTAWDRHSINTRKELQREVDELAMLFDLLNK